MRCGGAQSYGDWQSRIGARSITEHMQVCRQSLHTGRQMPLPMMSEFPDHGLDHRIALGHLARH